MSLVHSLVRTIHILSILSPVLLRQAQTKKQRPQTYIMLKTYKFKTHCKSDSHSSKTANIVLPGLMIKQRWTSLQLQAKWYSNSLNCALCWLKQLISPKLNSLSLLYFACIDLHQTWSVGEGSDHIQLIKFWLSFAPGRDLWRGEIFGSTLLQPACIVCVSSKS